MVLMFGTFCPQTINHVHVDCMTNLKIPKGYSESVNQTTQWPTEKVQTPIYKAYI